MPFASLAKADILSEEMNTGAVGIKLHWIWVWPAPLPAPPPNVCFLLRSEFSDLLCLCFIRYGCAIIYIITIIIDIIAHY